MIIRSNTICRILNFSCSGAFWIWLRNSCSDLTAMLYGALITM
jgi:hypothetical protein